MTLGENIARLRTQKDWSQGDLADALGISRQSISKWETDTSVPELEKLIKLSELFGVTLDQLVRGEDAPETESVPASSAPQAAPEREKRHTIAGTALLCTGAVILVLWLLLTGDLLTGLMFASPFLICGIIFLAVKRHWSLLRVGGLSLRGFIPSLCDRSFMDGHLRDALLDGGAELCAPCHRVGAVPRHGPDDRLHDALLPDASAARDEKRGHMAYCRMACCAGCASAFDELRHHAAVER